MKRNFVVMAVIAAVVMSACIDGIPDNPFLGLPVKPERYNVEKVHAAVPVITAHPQDAVYTLNAPAAALTVKATVDDGGKLSYQWYRDDVFINNATKTSYTPPTDAVGTAYYYVVVTNTIADNGDGGNKTATAVSGTAAITVSETDEGGQEVLYTIVVDMIDNEQGDTVTVAPGTGSAGDSITIEYTVAAIKHYNLLYFGGVTASIGSVDSAGSGNRTYTVNADDASNGKIIIIATFEHTDLIPDPITFNDSSPIITKTYGDAAFTNAVCTDHSGAGAVSYSSSDETVAVVDNNGAVTIRTVGSAVITARKEADAVYASAPASYTLNIVPKALTLSIPEAALSPIDTSVTVTVTVNGLIAPDTAAVSIPNTTLPAGLTLSGSTLTYNGTAPFTNAVPLNITASAGSNYTTGTGTMTVNVYDGQANYNGSGYDRRIPVNSANITRANNGFNAYACTDDGLTCHYKLTENVTLSGTNNWTAIGYNYYNDFAGSFNGQNYTITNLSINATGSNQGMFGYTGSGGMVQNVGLVGVSISVNVSGINHVGGVAGINGGTVQNCYSTGSVGGNCSKVGGVVGLNGGTVQNCYSRCNVNGNPNTINVFTNVGGVVGENSGTVQNCYATGSVSGVMAIGGVVGYSRGVVQNCYSTGNVTGTENYVGGVAGYNDNNGTVRDCVALNYNVLKSSASANYLGRVVGRNYGTLAYNWARSAGMRIMYSWNGTTGTNKTINAGYTTVDGYDVSNNSLSLEVYWSNIFGWDLTNVWEWGGGRPILRNMPAGTQ